MNVKAAGDINSTLTFKFKDYLFKSTVNCGGFVQLRKMKKKKSLKTTTNP